MFVKIKLEPQSSKALSPLKNITYFPVDDDDTVVTLKKKIEQYVNVPAERQEVRTLTKTFSNGRKVKEICNAEGSSIMLYDHDAFSGYEEGSFVCFLQIFTNEMALNQQGMEQRSSLTAGTTKKPPAPNSSSSSVTLIADTESDCSSDGSESQTASSNDCSDTISEDSSSSGSDNSKSSGEGKKRPKQMKNNKNQKKMKSTTVMDNLTPTICKYLDEFPKCSEPIDQPTQGPQSNSSPTTSAPTHVTRTPSDEVSSGKKPLTSQANITSTTVEVCHPCHAIDPERRQYIVTVSKAGSIINKTHCEKLFDWFFDRFRSCEISSQLQFFENNSAITLFEGKLWIACLNKQTFEWVCSCLSQYSIESFNFTSLNDSDHMAEVVVPQVSTNRNCLHIFHLLEKQNKNLSTLRWTVVNRKILQPEDNNYDARTISAICTNELLSIRLDAASKELLEKVEFKLKYCFWQIVFNFIKM